MTRLPNWPSLLEAFLSTNQHRKFAYGSWDCCLMCCEALYDITGVDVGEPFRGRYTSRAGAFRFAVEHSGRKSIEGHVENVANQLGLRPIGVGEAQRGDVVLIGRGRDRSLGIVALNGQDAVITSDHGLWRIPLTRAVRAWRV